MHTSFFSISSFIIFSSFHSSIPSNQPSHHQTILISIHLFIHLYVYQSFINPSIHLFHSSPPTLPPSSHPPSIYLTIHLYVYQSSINPSIHLFHSSPPALPLSLPPSIYLSYYTSVCSLFSHWIEPNRSACTV